MVEPLILKKILELKSDPKERAQILEQFSQIDGNAEFMAFYLTEAAFSPTVLELQKFEPKSGIMKVWLNVGREKGDGGIIYCLVKVDVDEFFSLGKIMRQYCEGNVTMAWLGRTKKSGSTNKG